METLKDIHTFLIEDHEADIELIPIEELRAKAVRDIKAIHKGELVPDDVEEYIRWKFNLTEADLQEEKK